MANELDQTDSEVLDGDRGDMGAVADPQWSDRWSRWAPAKRDEYIASSARWTHLDAEQATHLIQGLPPRPHGYLPTTTCLAEGDATCTRLVQDIARGALPKAMTPSELAAWCDHQRVGLPEAFVAELAVVEQELRQSPPRPQTTTSPITVPPWAPLPVAQPASHAQPRTRGRPATRGGDYAACVAGGKKIVMDEARNGRKLSLGQVAAKLAQSPAGAGMSVENIKRRLKGQLPLKAASELASRTRRAR